MKIDDIEVTFVNLTEENKKKIANLVVDLIGIAQKYKEVNNEQFN